jgi:hypothetical protein
MKRLILVAEISASLIGSVAHGASTMQSATAECRDEAVSTGLEYEADIQAYVGQCLQRFAGLPDYEEPTGNEYPGAPADEATTENETVE